MIEHVAYGIIIDDIVFPTGETRMGVLGGGGVQTAWGMAAALNSGTAVGLVAGVGNDLPADALDPLRATNIDLHGVRSSSLPTPRSWQIVEFDGRRRHLWRVPENTLGVQLERGWDVLPDNYRNARTFHWGIHPDDTQRDIAWAKVLHNMGRVVCFEPFQPPNQPLSDDALKALCDVCTVFSPNWHEACAISGTDNYTRLRERFRTAGCQILALRRGEHGADIWDFRANTGVHLPAVKTYVVDVVGAGNAFCGALLAQLQNGIEKAGLHASVAASYLVEQVGIPAKLPDLHDYQRRLSEAQAGLTPLS